MPDQPLTQFNASALAREWVASWKKTGQLPCQSVPGPGRGCVLIQVTEDDIVNCLEQAIHTIADTPLEDNTHITTIVVARSFEKLGLTFMPGKYGPERALAILREARRILLEPVETLRVA